MKKALIVVAPAFCVLVFCVSSAEVHELGNWGIPAVPMVIPKAPAPCDAVENHCYGTLEPQCPLFSLAQATPRQDQRDAPKRPDNQKYREWMYNQLREYLKLDESTSKRFKPLFLEYTENHSKLMRENTELVRYIARNVDNEAVSSKELQNLGRKYREINHKLWQERIAYYQKASKVLNERQALKLLIYEEKVKDDFFHRVQRSREIDREQRGETFPKFGPPPPQKNE